MAGLDDLLAQIPIQDIASKVGADEGEVDSAIQTLIPVLVGGLQHNAEDPDSASQIESAASSHAARGLLDSAISLDQLDADDGGKAIAKIFGGNDTAQVATALAGGGAGNGDLLKKLLPILAPIVLAYIGKQMMGNKTPEPQPEAAANGGLGDVLGSILGGGSGGNQSMGSILGGMLGGKTGGAIGDILGGLLGGKK